MFNSMSCFNTENVFEDEIEVYEETGSTSELDQISMDDITSYRTSRSGSDVSIDKSGLFFGGTSSASRMHSRFIVSDSGKWEGTTDIFYVEENEDSVYEVVCEKGDTRKVKDSRFDAIWDDASISFF